MSPSTLFKRPARQSGLKFSLAFGGLFVLIGVGVILFLVLPTLYKGYQAADWKPVQAQLDAVELKSHRSDKSSTYKVVARYHYAYDGQPYESNRVGLTGISDNIGNWHQDTYAWLHQAFSEGRPVTVYVDPANPHDAVIDRNVRWGLMAIIAVFALVFAGLGFGFMAMVWHGAREASRVEQARQDYGVDTSAIRFSHGVKVESNARTGVVTFWIFAIFWNLLSLPGTYILLTDPSKIRHGMAYLVLLFPLAGLYLLFIAIRKHAEWRRFGNIPLVMDPYPGAIGGEMAGYIDLPVNRDPGNRYLVTLACIRRYVSGSGKDRSTRESVKWEDEGTPVASTGPLGTRLAIRFRVPPGLPASEPASSDYHCWRVLVDSDIPGVDFERQYEIEMQPGEEASLVFENITPTSENGPAIQIQENVVQIRTEAGCRVFDYPSGRNPGAGLSLAVFGGFFLAIGLLMGLKVGGLGWLFSLVFMPIGGLIVLMGLWMLFTRLKVIVSSGGVVAQRYLFGVPLFSRKAAASEYASLKRRQSMSAHGSKTTIWYSIILNTKDGRSIVVADFIKGVRLTRSIGQRLGESLDLSFEQA